MSLEILRRVPLLLLMATALGACVVPEADFQGAQLGCGAADACPGGFVCDGEVCVPEGTEGAGGAGGGDDPGGQGEGEGEVEVPGEGEGEGEVELPCEQDVGQPCGDGRCAGGETICDPADPTATVCSTAGRAVEEDCNGDDDDCDGTIDNNLLREGLECEMPLGCQAAGRWSCGAAGAWACLLAEEPDVETCNGADDDCDGEVDDNLPDVACRQDMDGPGGCSWPGVEACLDDGSERCDIIQQQHPDCDDEVGDDVCSDGLDNDGDGLVDCNDRGCQGSCGEEGAEQCDGQDNDEDGDVDEGQLCGVEVPYCQGGDCVEGLGDDEFEPNNSLAEALEHDILESGRYPGLTMTHPDSDVFALPSCRGGRYVIGLRFTHLLGDVELKIEDGQGQQVAASSDASDNEHIGYVVPLEDERSFFAVVFTLLDHANNYALDLDFSQCPGGNECDHGCPAPGATRCDDGGVQRCDVSAAGCRQWSDAGQCLDGVACDVGLGRCPQGFHCDECDANEDCSEGQRCQAPPWNQDLKMCLRTCEEHSCPAGSYCHGGELCMPHEPAPQCIAGSPADQAFVDGCGQVRRLEECPDGPDGERLCVGARCAPDGRQCAACDLDNNGQGCNQVAGFACAQFQNADGNAEGFCVKADCDPQRPATCPPHSECVDPQGQEVYICSPLAEEPRCRGGDLQSVYCGRYFQMQDDCGGRGCLEGECQE